MIIDDRPDRRIKHGFVGCFICRRMFLGMVLCGFFILSQGCSSVPNLSKNGYDQAVALMSVCNRQSEEGLAILKNSIEQAVEQGELPDNEGKLLMKVVQLGETGKWEAAKSRARAIMDRQKSNRPR